MSAHVTLLAKNLATAGRVRQDLADEQNYNALAGFAMSFSQEIATYVVAITLQVAKVRLATSVNWITVLASMFLESTVDVTVSFAKFVNFRYLDTF